MAGCTFLLTLKGTKLTFNAPIFFFHFWLLRSTIKLGLIWERVNGYCWTFFSTLLFPLKLWQTQFWLPVVKVEKLLLDRFLFRWFHCLGSIAKKVDHLLIIYSAIMLWMKRSLANQDVPGSIPSLLKCLFQVLGWNQWWLWNTWLKKKIDHSHVIGAWLQKWSIERKQHKWGSMVQQPTFWWSYF